MSSEQKLSMSRRAVKRRAERALLRSLKTKCERGQVPRAQRPRRRNGKASQFATQSKIESGVDVVGVITLKSEMAVGASLINFVINPRSLPDTRLGQYTQLWARWTPKKLRVEVASAAGKMIPGSYILAWFADPTETLMSVGSANVTKLVSSGCSVQQPVGNNATLNIPVKTSRKFYSFKGDSFDDSHGVLLGCLSGQVAVSGAVTLTVRLHWTIQFDGPDLPVRAEENIIQPESDYAGIFTDSVSDWAAGGRLTFKHRSGGSVVPWEGVEAGVVYEPLEGVKIPYYDKDGVSKECKYFSKMKEAPNYPTALVCHASQADALAYISKGDISKVIPFKQAGEWATPDLPTLKGSAASLAQLILAPSRRPPLSREEPGPSNSRVSLARRSEGTRPHLGEPPGIDYELLAELVAAKLRAPSETSSLEVLDPNE